MSGLRVETTWRTVPCQPSQVSTTSNVLSNTLVLILTHLGIGLLQWINHCYVQGCVKVHVAEILLLLDEGGPCSHALLWHRRRRLESTFPAGQPNALKEHSHGAVQPKTFPVQANMTPECLESALLCLRRPASPLYSTQVRDAMNLYFLCIIIKRRAVFLPCDQ